MARLDQGWNREDIDFDASGRLVIKNPALARELREQLKRNACKLELFAQLSPTQSTVTQDTDDPCVSPISGDTLLTAPQPIGPPQPPPNMCGCNISVQNPKAPAELELGSSVPVKEA